VATDARFLGRGPWLHAMAGRLGDPTLTFSVRGSADAAAGPTNGSGRSVLAAVHAAVLRRPVPGEPYDLHGVVAGAGHPRPFTAAALAARAVIAERWPDPEQWLPNLLVMYPGYESFPVGPGAADPAVLDALVGAILDWAQSAGLRAVSFTFVRPELSALVGALSRHGFTPIPLTVDCELPVPGPTFEDYLATLSAKRRLEAGRELRRMRDAGVRLVQPSAAEVFDDLVRLRCLLQHKYRGRADEAKERMKIRRLIDQVAGGEPRVFCAVAGRDVLSAGMFVTAGDAWTCVLTGSDAFDPRSRYGYFATVYYEPVRTAAAAGVRMLHYGQASWQAKLSRGCRPTPLTGWVRALDPSLTEAVARSAAVSVLEY
jgi:uncharacterized protein